MTFASALKSLNPFGSKEEESLKKQEIRMSTTARSNPFDDIDGLVEALKNAPQDKEGAFRVATWRMVLEEMQTIKQQLTNTAVVVSETKTAMENTETPSVEQIKEQVKAELQNDLAGEDPDVILF